MHHLLPCQLDSIEMVPLSRASFRCHDNNGILQHYGNCEQEDGIREEMQEELASTSSQNSQSLTEELEQSTNHEQGEMFFK